MREFTVKAVLCGLVFGVLFGAANAYLGLKAGLTVSTSIPIAVLSVMVFKALGKGTILEANLAQTIGSASSSLASGTIFTIPALFLWGIVPPYLQVAVLALLGGLLGILAMVPLRRLLIVNADQELPYPEGRACAEVLQASIGGAGGGGAIVLGLLLGVIVKLLTTAWHLVPEEIAGALPLLPNANVALAIAPALLAVGFIIGFRPASVMLAGAMVSALVLYPLVTAVYDRALESGTGREQPFLAAGEVKKRFLLFVGAGAIAAAGLYTVVKTAPTMLQALLAVARGLRQRAQGSGERTDRDVPPVLLFAGLALVFGVAALVPGIFAGDLGAGPRVVAALGVVVFGCLFVPVSSRLVGVIGVSSNPTSAMALITLIGTALVFVACGLATDMTKATVVTVGTIVCVAASKAGDISQDLKTGFLVKGTPALQQYGQLLAAAVACWAVAGVVWAIGTNEAMGFGDKPGQMPAPQATLMKTVVEAVLGASLPWEIVLSGVGLGLAAILAGLPGLPFALGVYLPFATMATVFAGGVVRHYADLRGKATAERGVLCASGFVAGEGLAGVLIAGWALASGRGRHTPGVPTGVEIALGLGCLGLAAALLLRAAGRTGRAPAGAG